MGTGRSRWSTAPSLKGAANSTASSDMATKTRKNEDLQAEFMTLKSSI
jgi:hypothetical protein